ncbi:MAG: response regulator [Deltaproteobacteria bacterium]|nr:response regulator [Deltaproteobacteria bacterium]
MKNILIVDDNEEVRTLYQLALEGPDFLVKTSSSRNEALALLQTNWKPDLIILDFRMPGLSLNEFLDFLKSQESLSNCKVITMSSFSKRDQIIERSEISIPFFQKPSSIEDLVSIVKDSLSLV